MQKTCEQCSAAFEITPEETRLREKISSLLEAGPVPERALCFPCMIVRKMVWRNERVLYQRRCDRTRRDIIAMYPPGTPFPVYERSEWWSDHWDPLEYGRDFDFSRPFFEQFAELQKKVPRPALVASNAENCDYCNFAIDSRNCYLSHCTYFSESLLYCYFSLFCKDCTDCAYSFQCEQCLWCTDCRHSFGCSFCTLSHSCTDCFYTYDCRSCKKCFGCVCLRNKSYCMFNEQLTKEEYEQRLGEFDLQSPMHITAVEEQLRQLRLQHPRRYSIQEQTQSCTGDYIFESKNCHECFQVYRGEDCLSQHDADQIKDVLHCYHAGWSEVLYDVYSSSHLRNSAFTAQCWDGNDMFYSGICHFSSHCFGCIGLRHKQYCILNRQCTKEEYLALLPQIVAHMRKDGSPSTSLGVNRETGSWGEFFPITLSPFCYNETMAQEYFPFTKEEVLKRGWRWRDDLPFTRGKETTSWDQIPTRIDDVPDTIVDEVLACEATGKNYRIIPQELSFYRKRKLPLPRLHPDERHRRRMALRNPRKLFARTCAKCGKAIQTTYAPERPETVYCESCYLSTVY